MSKEVSDLPNSEEVNCGAVLLGAQISTLLADDEPLMHITMLLALKCGLRNGELMHIEFFDIDTSEKTLRVRGKPQWNFKVKDYEQRDIPIPDDLC